MSNNKKPRALWSKTLIRAFRKFKNPEDVQLYLNKLRYNPGDDCSSPEWVIRKKSAHCSEGAIFAAAALRFMGYPPLIIGLVAHNDDDHFLALFRKNGCWGAISKSNFTVLRYREAVYRNIRELVMSYFDFYYNTLGEKTLRAYTAPYNLARFDKSNWMITDKNVYFITDYSDKIKHYTLLNKKMISSLSPMAKDLVKAGLFGSVTNGLFKPKAGKRHS